MKKFIIVSLIVLGISILLVVAVFVYIQYKVFTINNSTPVSELEETNIPANSEPIATPPVTDAPEEGIPLSTLPLSDGQQDALRAVNVNPDTFVITEAMITCAGGVLGQERLTEITAGASPSLMESLSLMKCVQ